MLNNINKSLDTIENLIHHSEVDLAQRELIRLLNRKMPRHFLARVGGLLVRAGLSSRAIKLLHPFVHPKGKQIISGSAYEKAEYASALTFTGATEEARTLLKMLEPEDNPRVFLYRAFVSFARWEYQDAVPVLREYLKNVELGPYDKALGKINLVAALVHLSGKDLETESLLKELRGLTNHAGFRRFKGIVLELSAQHAFFNNNMAIATAYLKDAKKIFSEQQSREALFVNKWMAILELVSPNSRKNAIHSLLEVRKEAIQLCHWETLRDCDRFQGLFAGDDSLLTHVYYGTPYEAFRQELTKQSIRSFVPPNQFNWILRDGAHLSRIELATAEIEGRPPSIRLSSQLHRLFAILTSDFYRPFSIPSLFENLYRGEWFNPVTSPPRVHRLIQRLREWFKGEKIPLNVQEKAGAYSLIGISPICILLHRDASLEDSSISKLRKHLSNRRFTVQDVIAVLDVSRRTAQRILLEISAQQLIRKDGKTSSTKYCFVQSPLQTKEPV